MTVWELTGISFVFAAALVFVFFKSIWTYLDKRED